MAQSLSPNERSAQDIPLLPVLDINTHIDMDEPTTLDHVDGLDHVDIQPVSPIQDSEDDTISHVEASNTAVRDPGQPSRGSEDSPEDRQKPDARALHTRYGGVSGLFTDAWMLIAPILFLVLAILVARANGRPGGQSAFENAVSIVSAIT